MKVLEGTRELSVEVCDPSGGPFSLDITNPFLPYPEGGRWVLEGGGDRVQITVLSDTEVVAGVTTRVVEEREWEGGELVEVSRNFVVQAPDGSVCYYGEEVDDYDDGKISGHGGAWRAGEGNAKPGILMAGRPEVGISHKLEVSPGSAEDAAAVVAIGDSVTVPAGTFTDTLSVLDVNPLHNEVDPKHYARGIGMIVDEKLELIEYTLP
ncbi:MAG: hypothetical protein ABFS46_19685 [Myxococcota bacterium]